MEFQLRRVRNSVSKFAKLCVIRTKDLWNYFFLSGHFVDLTAVSYIFTNELVFLWQGAAFSAIAKIVLDGMPQA